MELKLSYRFEPGSAHDGVTVHVPLKTLPQLQNLGFEWLVPALRAELVTALIRSLPKELRKRLVPVPDVVATVLERMTPRSGPLLQALAAEIEAQRGVRIPLDAWDLSRLPSYLKMTFSVEDEQGKVIAAGQDLDALREQVRPTLRAALAAATRKLERTGQTSWTFGTIPKAVALPGTGQTVRAYPSLVDEGETVGLRALESPGAQALNMRVGTRRLLALTIPSPLRHYQRGKLGNAAQLVLMEAPHASPRAVLEDAATAAISSLMAAGRRPGVGRGVLRPPARLRRRPRRRRDRPDRRPDGEDPAGRARRARAAGHAARRGVRRGPPRRRPAARPARLPRLHHARPAPAGWPTSSATCAAPTGGWSACTRRRRSTATGCAPSTSSRTSTGGGSRSCPRAARGRRAERGAVAARGAADEPVRAGDRLQGPGVEPQDPPDPRRGPLTRTTRRWRVVQGF